MTEEWSDFYQRLDAARAAVAHGLETRTQDQEEILRTRARLLAQAPDRGDGADRIEVLEFQLAEERYAVVSPFVREVYPLRDLTELPGTPPFVLGIVNVRGQILSVLDLKKFFGLPDRERGELDKVIILKAGGMELGVLAEAVLGVRSLPVASIQPPLPTLTDLRSDYLLGVTHEQLAVLDAGSILSDSRILVDEAAEA